MRVFTQQERQREREHEIEEGARNHQGREGICDQKQSDHDIILVVEMGRG